MPRRLHAEKMISNSNAHCRRMQVQMTAMLDGTVPQQKRYAIERHLASCSDCALVYADYQRVEQLLGTARFALPAAGDLLPGFTARLESSGIGPANQTRSKRRRISYALAAPAFALGAAAVAFVVGTSIAPHSGSSARHSSSPPTAIASLANGKTDTTQTIGRTGTTPRIANGLPDGHHGNASLHYAGANPSSRPVVNSPEAAGTGGRSIGAGLYQETARINQKSSLSRYSNGFRVFADNFGYGLSDPFDADRRVAQLRTGAKMQGRFKSTAKQQTAKDGQSSWSLNKQHPGVQIALGDKRNPVESLSENGLMMDSNTISERGKDKARMGESIASGSTDRNASSFALGLANTAQASQPEMYYYESETAPQEPDTTLVVQDDTRGFTSIVQTVRKPVDTTDPNALRIEEDTESETGVKPGAESGH